MNHQPVVVSRGDDDELVFLDGVDQAVFGEEDVHSASGNWVGRSWVSQRRY